MDTQKAKLDWWNKLKKPFRVVFIDEHNIQELHSVRSSGLNILLIMMGICFAVFVITLLLLSFTPIKYYLPGVGNVKNHPEYVELNHRVVDMEKALNGQQKYLDQLQAILGNSKADGETKTSASSANVIEPKAIISEVAAEPSIISSTKALSGLSFRAPLKGSISQAFSRENEHFGIDLVAASKTAVNAVLDGRVIFADWTLDGGNTLVIQHTSNLLTIYKHSERLLKSVGDKVRTGEAIAIIGNTGLQTDGPHLHFELWYEGRAINAADWIDL